MAKLTYQKRKRMRDTSFALEEERKYPIDTIARGRNALARVAQHGTPAEQAEVKREVYGKYPSLRPKTDVSLKITDNVDRLEGVEKAYWDGRNKKLTVYYDEKYTSRQMGVRVGDYLARRQLQLSVDEIKLISTPKGTFRPINTKYTRSTLTDRPRITPKRPRIR